MKTYVATNMPLCVYYVFRTNVINKKDKFYTLKIASIIGTDSLFSQRRDRMDLTFKFVVCSSRRTLLSSFDCKTCYIATAFATLGNLYKQCFPFLPLSVGLTAVWRLLIHYIIQAYKLRYGELILQIKNQEECACEDCCNRLRTNGRKGR